jgi:hypothetical protein
LYTSAQEFDVTAPDVGVGTVVPTESGCVNLSQEAPMHGKYEIYGALPMHSQFRHAHAVRLVERLANPAHVYFATDAVTHTLVLRVSGRLSETEQSEVEDTLARFSNKWARAGAIFSRNLYGNASLLPIGLDRHVELLAELDELDQQVRAMRARQAWILARLEQPA